MSPPIEEVYDFICFLSSPSPIPNPSPKSKTQIQGPNPKFKIQRKGNWTGADTIILINSQSIPRLDSIDSKSSDILKNYSVTMNKL